MTLNREGDIRKSKIHVVSNSLFLNAKIKIYVPQAKVSCKTWETVLTEWLSTMFIFCQKKKTGALTMNLLHVFCSIQNE